MIDFVANNNVIKNATIKNLTINITSSYCERGINFNNANGTLLIENVTFEGTAPTYAVNFPAKAAGARATIKDSKLVGNIALNVWSENMKIDVSTLSLLVLMMLMQRVMLLLCLITIVIMLLRAL